MESHSPSINKCARLICCLLIICWYSIQMTCDVELQEKKLKINLHVQFQLKPLQVEPHLSSVLVMKPKGINDQVELVILLP